MEKQLIISIGREFGSGGYVIAEELSKRFNLPLYDHNLLDCIAEERNIASHEYAKYDEVPRNRFFTRTVRQHSSSPQEHIANMQFDYLRRMAAGGQSFVVVGRCAETKLKDHPALVSLFILGDIECKVARVMNRYQLSEEDARRMCQREDAKRKSYHNYYCKGKWGDSRNYDLSVNSSCMGVEATMDFLEGYIRTRLSMM